jgi:Bax protein
MVKRTKNKNIKHTKKKNNIFRFSAISLIVIFSFFTLPTIKIFLDKNLNFNKSVISNAGVNFDQELEKRKKILDGQKETKTKNLSLKNIFADIDFFSTDDEGQNSIRFDARTIEQLFKDTNYDLKRVRETKLVNI